MAKEIQFLLYNLPDNSGVVQAVVQDETIFLTQKAMAELFDVEVNTINYHLKDIYSSGELEEDSTIRKIRTVQKEGKRQVERERGGVITQLDNFSDIKTYTTKPKNMFVEMSILILSRAFGRY